MNQNDFTSFYSSQSLSEYTLEWFGGLFHARPEMFGFLVQHFAKSLFGFSVWCFKMEFQLLPDLLNTGFTIIEIGLLYGGENWTQRDEDSNFFWQNGEVYLISWRCVKTLQIFVEFF